MIQAITSRARTWREEYSCLSLPIQLYGAGFAVVGLAFFAAILRAPGAVIQPLMAVAAANLMMGFVGEAYARISELVKSTWVKWAFVPIASMVVASSLGLAGHTVSEATGQDPSYFPLAVSFLAPLAVLPVLALAGATALILLSMILMLPIGANTSRERMDTNQVEWLPFSRLLGVICTMAALFALSDSRSPLNSATITTARWAAYFLDMHQDTECGFERGDGLKRINDNLVIRARRDGYGAPIFTRQACTLGPQ